MPALMAVISADANPMRRELAAVQRMARQAGADIQSGLGGGGRANTGAIAETVVLLRELMRGNFSRVPGSLTLLAQRLGLLKFMIRDTEAASRLLADAWQAQSEKAGLAALMATRKAAASQEAMIADAGETEATLAQAVADEEGAAAAILNAKATQAKAAAAAEAAAAAGATTAAAAGPLLLILGPVLAIIAGAMAASHLTKVLVENLAGLKTPDFNADYIPQHLKMVNQAAEAQKDINREVAKTIDLYNGAAKAAGRVADATREHFAHLLRMNEMERDPAKRAAGELAIKQQERAVAIENKTFEQANLAAEGQRKKAQADAVRVSSKEQDENDLKLAKERADVGRKYMKDVEDAKGKGTMSGVMLAYNTLALSGVSSNDLTKAALTNQADANKRIQDEHVTEDRIAANAEARKQRDALDKEAGEAQVKAAELQLEILDDQKTAAQANQDDAEEAAAEKKRDSKMEHGKLTSNQEIGAYAGAGVLVDVAKSQLHRLTGIEKTLNKIAGARRPLGHDGQF
jgi:hypothetical protein